MRPAQRAQAIPHARPTVPSSAPRKTAAAPVAASKSRANAVVPLTFKSLDIPRDNTPISDIYARYRPQRIDIAGAQEHPTPLVESIAMASVAPPVPSGTANAELRLPAKLIEEGHLSEAQLETIIMAHDAHGRDLPGRMRVDDDHTKLTRADDDPEARAYRLGYFLGDGTGCGKGRECAGLILVNWLAGRRNAIWVSKSATLIEDAIRDWTDLGGSPADIQPLSKWKPDQPIPMGDGILFVTYATLRSSGKCGTTRLSQILDWMGEGFDGVLAFDEAHAMQNAAGSEQGRGVKPSQQGLAGLRPHFSLGKTRLETLAVLLVGLANGRTVNLSHLASQFPGSALHASNYRRLQRFFQLVRLDTDTAARLVVRILNLGQPRLLALDWTQWALGSREVNILVLAVVTRRFRVPLMWTLLDHRGCSNTAQRIDLMEMYVRLFGAPSIKAVLADREFIGTEWIEFLNENNIPFGIRLKENMRFHREDGSVRDFPTLLRKHRRGTWTGWLTGMQTIPEAKLQFAAKRIRNGELLIVATNLDDGPRSLNLYRRRWDVECLFADAKTRGFNIEDTHITDPAKLGTLLVIIALAVT
jgi:hypothetical protein